MSARGNKRSHEEANTVPLRTGQWTAAEIAFANQVIAYFHLGSLPNCENGATLRALLAELLHCSPMRISKKFAGDGAIGKRTFTKVDAIDERARVDLQTMELAFHESIDGCARRGCRALEVVVRPRVVAGQTRQSFALARMGGLREGNTSSSNGAETCATPGCPGSNPDGLGNETCMHCGDSFCSACAMHARDDALGVGPGGESPDMAMQIGVMPMSACDACHKIACRACATMQNSASGPDAFYFNWCSMCGQKKACMSCVFGDTPGQTAPFMVPCTNDGCINTICLEDCYFEHVNTLHVEQGMSMDEAMDQPPRCRNCV